MMRGTNVQMMSPEITEDDVFTDDDDEVKIAITDESQQQIVKKSTIVEEEPVKEGAVTPAAAVDDDDVLAPYKVMFGQGLKIVLLIAVIVYLVAAFIINFKRAKALFTITILVIAYMVYAFVAKQNEASFNGVEDRVLAFMERTDTDWKAGGGVTLLLSVIVAVMMAFTVRDSRNLVSLFGMFVFLGLTWLFSWKPSKVKLRPVIGALFLQFVFGFAVIRTKWGFNAIQFLGDTFITVLGYTTAGSSFVFGWLTDGRLFGPDYRFNIANGETFGLGPPFFFNVLPTVIFFSAIMSVGYYIGALPFVVRKLGYFLSVILGTSASESLSAAGNIFVGQTEAPLMVKPFMPEMTESELHAIMTGGFATIAGSVFGIYVFFGVDPVAILAASVMSAPAALAVSKIAYPETEESPTAVGKRGNFVIPKTDDANIMHAATNGAVVGTQLMLNIAGNLIAFLAIIQMLDQLIIYLGTRVDADVSFTIICEYLFYPLAWLMGVDADDCSKVAILLGVKVFANEFVAYEKLTGPGFEMSPRSFLIASYALCGFSNFGSIGIQLGGLTPLAPNQGPKLAKLVFSAMIAGNTACLLTACIAGIFYEET